jgi:hypothetical protein
MHELGLFQEIEGLTLTRGRASDVFYRMDASARSTESFNCVVRLLDDPPRQAARSANRRKEANLSPSNPFRWVAAIIAAAVFIVILSLFLLVSAPTEETVEMTPEPARPKQPKPSIAVSDFRVVEQQNPDSAKGATELEEEPIDEDTDDSEIVDFGPIETAEPQLTPGFRKWVDASGDFPVTAKFGGINGDRVQLHTEDDRLLKVPISKLSEEDKEFLRSIYKKNGLLLDF